jgi:hypothetical protein
MHPEHSSECSLVAIVIATTATWVEDISKNGTASITITTTTNWTAA